MLIGIISDTHDNIVNIEKAVRIFTERKVDRVIHAGDIISPGVIPRFKELDNISFIFGNNDGERAILPKKIEQIGGVLGGETLDITCDEGRIAVYHGTVPQILNALISCGDYRVVISGHTHKIVNRMEGNTRVLNPGSAHGFDDQPTVMVYDAVSDEAEVIEIK